MHSPSFIQSTMKFYKCSAVEACQYLSASPTKAFLFSSGEVYIPPMWPLKDDDITS